MGPSAPRARLRLVPLSSGALVLHEGDSCGIAGVVLAVAFLHETRAALGEAFGQVDEGVALFDPDQAFGLRIGFTEIPGGPGGREA